MLCKGARMSKRSDSACPLCGKPLSDGPTDRDHVFGEAFGGRATVRTHKACNNELGHGAEGRLHRPNTLLSTIRAARGMPAPELRGTNVDGTKVAVDLATGQSFEARPTVRVTEDVDRIELLARGAEPHVRAVLNDWRRTFGEVVPTWNDLPPEARTQIVGEPVDVNISITHNLDDAREFAIKAALEAGVLAFGEAFAASDVALALRSFRDNGDPESTAVGLAMSVEALRALDETFARQSASYESSGLASPNLPSLENGGYASDVSFVPVGNRTSVFVRVLGMPMTDGIVIDAQLPSGDLGVPVAPVLIREGTEGVQIVDFTKRLIDPVSERAKADAEALRREVE